MAAIFYTPKSPMGRGVKYSCRIIHPLKDQRKGVKYGRGVKYGVTQDGFFCHLAGRSAPTGLAIVHCIGYYLIKI